MFLVYYWCLQQRELLMITRLTDIIKTWWFLIWWTIPCTNKLSFASMHVNYIYISYCVWYYNYYVMYSDYILFFLYAVRIDTFYFWLSTMLLWTSWSTFSMLVEMKPNKLEELAQKKKGIWKKKSHQNPLFSLEAASPKTRSTHRYRYAASMCTSFIYAITPTHLSYPNFPE